MIEIDQIYNEDCLEGMKRIDDASVDCVVTSPPYYNAMEYSHWPTYQDYLNFMENVLCELMRVLNVGRYCIINVSCVIEPRKDRNDYGRRYPIPFHFVGLAEKVGMDFVDDIIWRKPDGAASNRGQKFYHLRQPMVYRANNVTEYILVFRKPGIRPEDVYRAIGDDIKAQSRVDGWYFRTNVWDMNPNNHNTDFHPATFPLLLPYELVRYYSFVGHTILDPFIGSGTTAIACLKEHRHFIGFELNKEYFDIAQRRIALERQQLQLDFTE